MKSLRTMEDLKTINPMEATQEMMDQETNLMKMTWMNQPLDEGELHPIFQDPPTSTICPSLGPLTLKEFPTSHQSPNGPSRWKATSWPWVLPQKGWSQLHSISSTMPIPGGETL